MTAEWAVFAGPAWPPEQDSPEAHLVGLFSSLREAYEAFAHVSFVRLQLRRGRLRWRGAAPFGAAIVQIEHHTGHHRDVSAARNGVVVPGEPAGPAPAVGRRIHPLPGIARRIGGVNKERRIRFGTVRDPGPGRARTLPRSRRPWVRSSRSPRPGDRQVAAGRRRATSAVVLLPLRSGGVSDVQATASGLAGGACEC